MDPNSRKNLKRQREEQKEQKKKRKEGRLLRELVARPVEVVDGVKPQVQNSKKNRGPGRQYTVSVALPGSILSTAHTLELRTLLAGQIARALSVFSVDEVVVFDEEGYLPVKESDQTVDVGRSMKELQKSYDPNLTALLAFFLQFLECPQYLRKSLFPQHWCLARAGLLNPLMIPSHTRPDEKSPYREGVVVQDGAPEGDSGEAGKKKGPSLSNLVDVGLRSTIPVTRQLPLNTRVTVRMPKGGHGEGQGEIVSPGEPRTEKGLYWGYKVRLVNRLSGALKGCPFLDEKGQPESYDLIIGTSERGQSVDNYTLPEFRHLLVVFGGVQGLERSLELDPTCTVDSPDDLCQAYLNTCPAQGSRTIRTEEALFVTLSTLRPKITSSGCN